MHHSSRPFWINFGSSLVEFKKTGVHPKGIVPAQCQGEFGNPSAHSLLAFYFSMYLFYVYILGNNQSAQIE